MDSKDLLTIYSKAMAAKSDAQYITQRMEAGLVAVRDSILARTLGEQEAAAEAIYAVGFRHFGASEIPLDVLMQMAADALTAAIAAATEGDR